MTKDKNCWYRLNVNVSNALKPDIKLITPAKGREVWQPKSKQVFTDEWLDYTESIGLPIYSALVFYRGPFESSLDAHIDLRWDGAGPVNFGINWVIGGSGSEMHWFDIPKQTGSARGVDNRAPYASYPFSELTEIDKCHIGPEVTLVQTGYPHSISMGKEARWCFSARTHINEDMPWDEVVSLMRSKKLLVEK